jgi:hypothetical protein
MREAFGLRPLERRFRMGDKDGKISGYRAFPKRR